MANQAQKICVAILVVCTLFCAPISAGFLDATQVKKVVIVGDDFSDIQNTYTQTAGALPPPGLYPGSTGAYTNGQVWWQYLLKEKFGWSQSKIDADVACLAYAGAGLNSTKRPFASNAGTQATPIIVPGGVQQMRDYLILNPTTEADTLFFVMIGWNEYLKYVSQVPQANLPFAIGSVVNETLALSSLLLASAPVSNIVFVSMFPGGDMPYVRGNDYPYSALALGKQSGLTTCTAQATATSKSELKSSLKSSPFTPSPN